MRARNQEVLDALFRDLVDVYPASHTSLLALDGFVDSLRLLKASEGTIRGEIEQLVAAIVDSRPRLFPLDNLIPLFLEAMVEQRVFGRGGVEDVVAGAIAILEDQRERLTRDIERLAKRGAGCVEDGDLLMVHSVDGTVTRIIPEARRQGKSFKVLILGQDFVKTRQIIKIMTAEGIEHLVIPEYSLAHFVGSASKLFVSAQAVTSDHKFVSDSGTASIVNTSHIQKLPVYLFVISLKLTHRKSDDQNINLKQDTRAHSGIEYAHVSHSHDIVDLRLVDHLIIEEGEISRAELEKYRPQLGGRGSE